MLEKYMKNSEKLEKMLEKIIVQKLQEMLENVRKVYENLR